jgi:hypothetical protein
MVVVAMETHRLPVPIQELDIESEFNLGLIVKAGAAVSK